MLVLIQPGAVLVVIVVVVGYITTYAVSACHHYRCEIETLSGEVYEIQHYVIQFVSDLLQVVFSGYSGFPHQ